MSSRQEEKERRRREREEAERAAAASADRRKRLGIVLGAVLAIAVAAIVVVAVASGGDDGSEPSSGGSEAGVPAREISDLGEAAKAAGCKVAQHKEEGRSHTSEDVKYKTNPPTSGQHDPVAAQDGVYPEPPDVEQSVHSLEHGRVLFQYKPGTPERRVAQLETMVNEEVRGTPGYHTLLFENQSEMPYAVVATSWTKSLTCSTFTDKTFDALRAFREANVDKAPEQVP